MNVFQRLLTGIAEISFKKVVSIYIPIFTGLLGLCFKSVGSGKRKDDQRELQMVTHSEFGQESF
jgi:hypothetical protein